MVGALWLLFYVYHSTIADLCHGSFYIVSSVEKHSMKSYNKINSELIIQLKHITHLELKCLQMKQEYAQLYM